VAHDLGGAPQRPFVVDVTVALPYHSTIGSDARRVLAEHLGPLLALEARADLELLASELASNAYAHGCEPVRMRIIAGPGLVRIEMVDGCSRSPALVSPSHRGGWGMHIVERVSRRWGCVATSPGKTVWAEVLAASAAEERADSNALDGRAERR
jgi:hypothetical protein